MRLPKPRKEVKDKYVGFTVTESYKKELEDLSEKLGVTLAELLRTAVFEYINEVKNQIK